MDEQNQSGISQYMQNVFKKYESIRGKDRSSFNHLFWDVVVITAADEEQKCIYEYQLELKSERNELPKGIPIHVIADPEGPKIGNGGSTLNAISRLQSKYGNEMFQYRILIIHAGGLSKRIPSTSILGKIFSPIPKGFPMYQMLDLKLAMFMPFVPRMPPGILVCCADDILVYNLGTEDLKWELSNTGFTVFAHPSRLEFGVKHGVYVIDGKDTIDTETLVQEGNCLEVMQKPSVRTMFEKGAVLNGEDLIFPDIKIRGRAVYTDSCFFFAMDVTKKFLNFVKENGLVQCEIDAYGDFLPALGPRATVDYIHNMSNVTTVLPNLLPTREKVFHLLQGTPIKLYTMNSSRYIHIGTTEEYITHFCLDSAFQNELCLQKNIFNSWTESKKEQKNLHPILSQKLPESSLGCVMHSVMPQDSCISHRSIVEFCLFDIPVHIEDNAILNNCFVSKEECKNELITTHQLEIPCDVFMHTIPVEVEGVTKFVTLNLNINDNLKQQSLLENISILGISIKKFCSLFELVLEQIIQGRNNLKKGSSVEKSCKGSLWDICVFPVVETASESFLKSLEIVKSVRKNYKFIDLQNLKLISIAEMIHMKNYKVMLEKRNELFSKIQHTTVNGDIHI